MENSTAVASARELDTLCINTIRFLSVDAVQQADSGHPGLPMGAATPAYVLWTHFLKHSPGDPNWFDRDRFVLSAGHGSMLLYSLLYLTGYDLPLEQIKQFRQWRSITPGHPERGVTAGVEVSTGPLGQGFANGVGMAIAEAHLAARYNRPGFEIINHFTYALVSDGDLMEGVANEAASLAGHLKLGKLIYLYDDNRVTLSESTALSFTEDAAKQFDARGWHTQRIDDANDADAIELALRDAQAERERPSLILIRSHLGFGAPHKQDTFEAHGSPLGEDEVRAAKQNLGWPLDPPFYVPEAALQHFRQATERGREQESKWQDMFSAYARAFPDLAWELQQRMTAKLPDHWDRDIPVFPPDPKGMATRMASGKVMNSIAPHLPALMGGSGDLNPSTYTALKELGDFQPAEERNAGVSPASESAGGTPAVQAGVKTQGSVGGGWSYAGRNLHFGVREHAMGSTLNGLAAHGGFIPFGSTFLTFSDYMRPPIRLAALSRLHVIYVFTHDSIGLGEDGPTHQPVEHLAALRAIPDLLVIRPGDANETAVAWRVAIELRQRPVALILSRQKVPTLDRSRFAPADHLRRGAYVLSEATGLGQASVPAMLAQTSGAAGSETGTTIKLILIASGSELSLAVKAQEKLEQQGVATRVVSMPSWELFEAQPQAYKDAVLPPGVRARLAIEAASPMGWCRWTGDRGGVVGVTRFGASAPGDVVLRQYGFNVDHVCEQALALLHSS
ncbi:MAG TPA: transketolase [Planctomycetota bacterium]